MQRHYATILSSCAIRLNIIGRRSYSDFHGLVWMGFDFKRRFIYQHWPFCSIRICSYQYIIFLRTTRSAHKNTSSNFWIERKKRIQGDLHELEVLLLTSQTREQAVVSRDHALIDINQFHFRRSERTNQKVLNQLILCCSKSGKLVGVLNERAGCQY